MDMTGRAVGFDGEVRFDPSKPDGAPRKLLDVGKINALGWKATTKLTEGLERTYAWYLAQQQSAKGPGKQARILQRDARG
jgi:GDP-L-fucose synthase